MLGIDGVGWKAWRLVDEGGHTHTDMDIVTDDGAFYLYTTDQLEVVSEVSL